MAKILIFIPHLDMKKQYEEVVSKFGHMEDIKIEMVHVFGTPESLYQNWDADIMVARGMTYDRLHQAFPQRHMVEISMTGFDIINALIKCKEVFHPKKIALCIHNNEIASIEHLELLCDAKIDLYDVYDENSAKLAIQEAVEVGTDVFVGAGTMCGLCDKAGLKRIHIITKNTTIEIALKEAINAAKTINLERAKSNMICMIMNTTPFAVIAIDENGKIIKINNQAYKTYQISTLEDVENHSIDSISKDLNWKIAMKSSLQTEEVIRIHDKLYYIQYKPIIVEGQKAGLIITTQNSDNIMEVETKIRRSLSEKGLTAKYTFDGIIGSSKELNTTITMAKRYSKVDSNVLIIGETGTGKELFAQSIHNESSRRKQPFVALNCAAVPENLLESELFGYIEGAFSGASKGGKMGLFELAHKGTIFLDEIGEIPIALQAKLLRVLQEKEIMRVGSNRVNPIDVRVISATNINIEKKIKNGEFRSDLYYRLNLLDLTILPLRERKDDIQDLVDYYLTKFSCELGKSAPRITVKAAKLLKEYSWPGNVRELRNICERLTVLNDKTMIDEEELLQIKVFRDLHAKNDKIAIPEDVITEDILHSLKRKKKKKEIADELGVSRTTLWRMMKKENI